MTSARRIAFEVLLRVQRGAFATDLLLAALEPLDSRDAGLAQELVMGSLRRQAQLDHLIAHFSGRKDLVLDPEVRIALRLGVYQLFFLERIPPHAAVGESVELVKQAKKSSAAGLVNAVLRKVRRGPVRWPDRATELSTPKWLLEGWERHYGKDTAVAIASAFLERPETWVRLGPAESAPQHVTLEPAPDVPGAYRVRQGDPRGMRIQDVGSQSIVPLLDLRPGLTFLDLCAAPGNKTAQAMESGVKAIACDLHWQRLRDFQAAGCARVTLDAGAPLPFRERFDRILVDAPCSGTGTLARNPEIKWRLQPEDLEDLAQRQTALLRRAMEALKPGGRLVYSTCSLEREENGDVARAVLGRAPEYEFQRVPGLQPGDGFYAAVIPSN
ncbi:MAG: transcription antitermination factor NusB [Bryobacteraceae bacterium]|nr:transcription antitermination factor NusB [Bryobacteraceae bacterium]